MSANVFGSKKFTPTPPMKGAFPLDHKGECKNFYLKYMVCLSENKNENSACRVQAKDYLQCRMDKELMERESLAKLGYKDLTEKRTDEN